MPSHINPRDPSGKDHVGPAADLRHGILDLIGGRRRPPADIVKAISASSNLPKRQVQAILRGLVAAGELSYTFEYGRTFLEPSFDRPVRVGERIVLTPPGRNFLPRPDDVVVQMAAGASFGAGRHPTTRLALRGIEAALDRSIDFPAQPATTVLDIGTGTGVLVIAAVKLGVQEGLGLDIDPCAVAEAQANIRLNGLWGRIAVSDDAVEGIDQQFTLIAANLRSPTLVRLSVKIAAFAQPAAAVVMSGIRNDELDGILRVYQELSFMCVQTDKEDMWVGVVLRKDA